MSFDENAVRGFAAPGFGPVRDEFARFFSDQWDVGSAFTAYLDGERVVHLQGGVRSEDEPYDERTVQLVASNSKFAESLGVALLVDRGLLQYDDRVTDHWPEFARGDAAKADVTVRQLMMHRAGLPAFSKKLGDEELFDAEARTRFLENEAMEPGLFSREPEGDWRGQHPAPPQAYHAVSRGVYASELTRRVDPKGRTLGRFIREELTGSLELAFWIGLPEDVDLPVSPFHFDAAMFGRVLQGDAPADDPRFALHDYELSFLRKLVTQPDSLQSRALNCLAPSGVSAAEMTTHPKMRACELPSSNGFGNAGAMAALAALTLQGGRFEGRQIFSHHETLQEACECGDEYAVDGLMLTPVAFTQGGFARLAATDERRTTTIGWGGAGGQMVRFIPELGIACAYITNTRGMRMAMHDPRGNALLRLMIECARNL